MPISQTGGYFQASVGYVSFGAARARAASEEDLSKPRVSQHSAREQHLGKRSLDGLLYIYIYKSIYLLELHTNMYIHICTDTYNM